jgi:hypothetical protein
MKAKKDNMNNLYKILGAIGIVISLAGCATTGPTTIVNNNVYVAISPPDTLYNCPQLAKFPNPKTLTNLQLANLITELVKDNRICGLSEKSIKDYVAKIKAQIEANNKA